MLSRDPSAREITLYLDMLSHFGRQTGYPALRVEVASPDELVHEDRDYLILGTYATQPAFAALRDSLPITIDAAGAHAKPVETYLGRFKRFWCGITRQPVVDQQLADNANLADAVIESVQSPYSTQQSLVVVALRDDSIEDIFADRFLDRSQSSDISQVVTLLRGSRFLSYPLDVAEYHVGTISAYTAMRIWLTQYFWGLLVAVTICTLILARWLRNYLADLAEQRLAPAKLTAKAL
jgi:cellulose synthase (UDP-forming)